MFFLFQTTIPPDSPKILHNTSTSRGVKLLSLCQVSLLSGCTPSFVANAASKRFNNLCLLIVANLERASVPTKVPDSDLVFAPEFLASLILTLAW
jgi:hypothetical protein